MLLPRLGAILLAVTSASAYKNASPFFLLSSTPLSDDAPLKRAQIALGQEIEDRLVQTLEACDKQRYYIFSQASVAADDLRNERMPRLQSTLENKVDDAAKFLGIPDVVDDGALKYQSIEKRLNEACQAKGKTEAQSWPESDKEYRIIHMELPELAHENEQRTKMLKETDDALADTVDSVIAKESSSVLIYLSTPVREADLNIQDGHDYHYDYEMDDPYPSSLHTELKRDHSHHARQSDDKDMQAGLPLFERYQFFTPPIFMGLAVSILLVAILSVGLRAISGLQVSYMAFSKEMGPQAQNKGKQQ